ncbi:MAG TPA: SDR family oxidoreductase, partial [Acidimicrobiales bacterium]|nr:SDR family oxidoreductase [Acidimicrobiales bacterium]
MNKTAFVTGASSGIGAAYAERLAAEGWDLVVVARRGDRLEELCRRLTTAHGVDARPLVADLGQTDDIERVGHDVEQTGPDLLVNNAGLAHYGAFAEVGSSRARELVDVNVLAPVLLAKAAVGGMVERGRGSIVNVASLLAFSGAADAAFLPERAVYAATKSFLVTFSQVLAAEVAASGVRVQVVCPGVVRSEFHSRQGIDMTDVPRMEPELVVEASLADLAAGVVVSVPGLQDLDALNRLWGAH